MSKYKPPKPKAINFELIKPMDGKHEPEGYIILREIRAKYHEDLHRARIALAWRKALKADKEGHLILGKCVKASDLQRELVDWDFVILLNQEIWQSPEFTPEKKRALIDHELSHAGIVLDKDYAPKLDERGRPVWRTRKHDIEEFHAIVNRHGLYKHDLEKFAEALLKKRELPLLAEMEKKAQAEEKAQTQ